MAKEKIVRAKIVRGYSKQEIQESASRIRVAKKSLNDKAKKIMISNPEDLMQDTYLSWKFAGDVPPNTPFPLKNYYKIFGKLDTDIAVEEHQLTPFLNPVSVLPNCLTKAFSFIPWKIWIRPQFCIKSVDAHRIGQVLEGLPQVLKGVFRTRLKKRIKKMLPRLQKKYFSTINKKRTI